MALVAKITDVGYQQTTDDGEGGTRVVDLSLVGRYYVNVDYYDTTAPTNILLSHTFELPQETSVEQAQATIVALGQRVRDARVRTTELRQFVGAVIPLT